MKKSAIIVASISSVVWLIQIGPIGVLTGIVGMIMSREAYQEYDKLAFGLSIFGFIMGLLSTIGIIIPFAFMGGITAIFGSNPLVIVAFVLIIAIGVYILYKKKSN